MEPKLNERLQTYGRTIHWTEQHEGIETRKCVAVANEASDKQWAMSALTHVI